MSNLLSSCAISPKNSFKPIVAIPPANIVAVHSQTPTTVTTSNRAVKNADPYQQFNRNTYRFNDKLDRGILKPVAQTYVNITPYWVRQGISNFFSNLGEAPKIANDLLQGRFSWAMNDLWRFIINSTVGLGGLVDIAKKMGIGSHTNTFGMTLSTWGAKPAPYVVLPLLGPSSLLEVNGMLFDFQTSPWKYHSLAPELNASLYTLQAINARAYFLQNEHLIGQVMIDRYLFIRNAYLQYRSQQMLINEKSPVNKNISDDTEEIYTGD